jgi:molybdopterin biosynthesis enzyme
MHDDEIPSDRDRVFVTPVEYRSMSDDGDAVRAIDDARDRLLALTAPIDRTDTVPLSVVSGRVLAEAIAAREAGPADGIEAGETLFEAGHRLRSTDAGLLKVAGIDDVSAVQRPTVGVLPTGDDLVQREAGAGERVETTAFTLAQHVDRWGGKVTYRNVVEEDRHATRAAIQRDLTRDALVLTGVDAPGESLVREVVADLGEIHVEAVATDPGGTTAVASVEDRPVLLLPDSPVDCLVATVQLLRPLVATLAGSPLPAHPHHHASMEATVESEPGVRTFVPVGLSDHVATPLGDGSPTLRDVARADGWVSIDEESAGLDADESVGVIDWEQA